MGFGVLEFSTGLGILLYGIYWYLTKHFNFWNNRNVKGPKPTILLGNIKDLIFGKKHYCLIFKEFYDEYKTEALIGIFGPSKPLLIVKDPDLIKDVLIKDFHIFADRGMYTSKNDILDQHLANLEYERWKPLRNKLSPAFTSTKLKEMFYLLTDCVIYFEKYLGHIVKKDEPVECRELAAKYTTQTIGSCVFGLDTKSLEDDISEFRKFGRDLFASSYDNVARRLLQLFAPTIYASLGPYKYSESTRFFLKSMKDTLEYRRKSGVRRNDFVDLMMDLQDQPDKISNIDFSDRFLSAQSIVFFAAGFETSSATISNTFYELAINTDVQDKLREEIHREIEKDSGKLTYDNIKRMKYLDKVVKETLRKYPPGSVLQRKSLAEYTFTGTKVTIPKDIKIMIPVWGIHWDPDIFPDPEKFDPERFNEENEQQRHPMNYLPFGGGPHNCIGMRFANYQSKMGIIAMIQKFKVDVCEKTCVPYIIEPRSIFPAPVGGIYLKISKV